MAPITLERDPLGTYILSCRCGNIEMGRGARWMAFRITPQSNGFALITCDQCEQQRRLNNPQPEPSQASTA